MDNVQIEATLEANLEGVKGSIRGVCRVSGVEVHGTCNTEDSPPVQVQRTRYVPGSSSLVFDAKAISTMAIWLAKVGATLDFELQVVLGVGTEGNLIFCVPTQSIELCHKS